MKPINRQKRRYLKAPFTYFGGKSAVASRVWAALGNVSHYVEPFFGSGAVLLARPKVIGAETINDACGYVSNFWRAVAADPDAVAYHADWPVFENDLHARHYWLTEQRLVLAERLEGDPAYFDAQIAGWWAWGMNMIIGGGFCSGKGPWTVQADKEGLARLVKSDVGGNKGVNRSLDATPVRATITRALPSLGSTGTGVNRKLPHSGDTGMRLSGWMNTLADRLRYVRVCCGDWSRVLTPAVTNNKGLTGVFLDPPYNAENHDKSMYAHYDTSVSGAVRRWAIENGHNPLFRIVLAGYEGEHEMPVTWRCEAWKAHGGYSNQSKSNENCKRERLWFSPHCLNYTPHLF